MTLGPDDDAPTIPPPGKPTPRESGAGPGEVTAPLGRTPGGPTAATTLAPGFKLGARYTIIKLLGRGGMGAVYQAWDDELMVPVAIKTILPDAEGDEHATHAAEARFKRELLLARQVTHKNVVRIHDLSEVDGQKYITMTFVEGETLGQLLKRSGSLPVPRALGYARQIADGLAAAHEVGIVHRDLKPENIMITPEGQALIMDFGIARGNAGTTETQAGVIMGTLEYMAPEQAAGRAVDHRADIYAFGLIVYDMLLGRMRTKGRDNPMTELLDRVQRAPEPPRGTRADVPEGLERIVMQCVQPDIDKRPATTAALVNDLAALTSDGHQPRAAIRAAAVGNRTRAALAVVTLAVAAAAIWFVTARESAQPQPREPISVLIADFENRTGDQVFEGALEQALGVSIESASFITAYSRRDALRTAEQIDAGTTLDANVARLVSRREGIAVVLAGSVAPDGSGYTLALDALNPDDGELIQTVSAGANDKAGVLSAVGKLAADMRRRLGDTTNIAADRETFTAASLDAARAYAAGQDLAASGRHEDAIEHYRQATALDPNFGRAYSGWATSAFRLGRRDEAEQLYEKAFGLLDRMTEREKFRTLGVYYGTIARNYDKAIENYQQLTSKYPSDGAGLNNLAVAYFNTLNFQQASDAGRRLLEIYPRRLLYRSNYALYAMYASDLDTAVAEARKVIDEDPTYSVAYMPLAVAAIAEGRFADAEAAYAAMAKGGAQGASRAAMGRADLLMYQHQFSKAIEVLKQGIATDEENANRAGLAAKLIALAEAQQALGDVQGSLASAKRAMTLVRLENAAFPGARMLLRAGRDAEALAIAATLSQELSPRSRAYGKLLEGESALARASFVDAVAAFNAARELANVWLARFDLGRAYVEAGRHAEALSELELCEKRRGEATALFLDDSQTLRYLAPLPYWLARAQQGLGLTTAAREKYTAFLALAPADSTDPLVVDARRRLAAY
jgi:eukaryotic-like serine/threonine-protein kinase